ncbi:unnamed protein product, partial [Mesorhabditis spiculigera]
MYNVVLLFLRKPSCCNSADKTTHRCSYRADRPPPPNLIAATGLSKHSSMDNWGYNGQDEGPSCDYRLPYCTVHAHRPTPALVSRPELRLLEPLDPALLRPTSMPNSNRFSQPPPYPAACIDSPPAYTPHPMFDDGWINYNREPGYHYNQQIARRQARARRRVPHHHRDTFSRRIWRNKRLLYGSVFLFLIAPIALMFIIMAGVGVL